MKEENKKQILVVDDEQDVVEAIRDTLETSGYEVQWAFDGQTGLSLATKNRPDMVILDLVLPKMDGMEVYRALKADKETSKIPVLVVTGRVDELDKLWGRETGNDDYLVKPFERDGILGKVNHFLAGTPLPGVNELLTSFIHELRSPLSTVKLAVENLMADRDAIWTARQQKNLDLLRKNIDRLTGMIDNFHQGGVGRPAGMIGDFSEGGTGDNPAVEAQLRQAKFSHFL